MALYISNMNDKVKYHEPFSPVIMESKVPDKFLKLINDVGDEVLSDEVKSREWDWSGQLVGKVHKEVRIPITNKEDSAYCLDVIRKGCLQYLNNSIRISRAHIDLFTLHSETHKFKHGDLTEQNIRIDQTWIVSQYKGEYNPWHKHSGHLSGVIYLKIPKDMDKHFEKEMEDHYPVSGMIQFTYGESANLRSDTLTFKPEVGQFLIFPSWLKHSVYPFYCDGERRSMSFNVYYRPVG